MDRFPHILSGRFPSFSFSFCSFSLLTSSLLFLHRFSLPQLPLFIFPLSLQLFDSSRKCVFFFFLLWFVFFSSLSIFLLFLFLFPFASPSLSPFLFLLFFFRRFLVRVFSLLSLFCFLFLSLFSPCLLSYLLFPFLPFFPTEFISIFVSFQKIFFFSFPPLLSLHLLPSSSSPIAFPFFSFLFSLSYSHISSNNSSPFPSLFPPEFTQTSKKKTPISLFFLPVHSLQKIPRTLNYHSLLPTPSPLLRTISLSM